MYLIYRHEIGKLKKSRCSVPEAQIPWPNYRVFQLCHFTLYKLSYCLYKAGVTLPDFLASIGFWPTLSRWPTPTADSRINRKNQAVWPQRENFNAQSIITRYIIIIYLVSCYLLCPQCCPLFCYQLLVPCEYQKFEQCEAHQGLETISVLERQAF